ncbi:MAG: ribbon-helix-helix domain-containing protein [Bryobacteraceae bacterium]|nr:ribbon-helix-helix domain-containing protein [Bryobacteraceae bacterium]
MPDDLLAQLDDCAKARRVTKSALVREGLSRILFEHPTGRPPSCFDLAVDLAGAVKGLPEDLADDPKHLNGFGE